LSVESNSNIALNDLTGFSSIDLTASNIESNSSVEFVTEIAGATGTGVIILDTTKVESNGSQLYNGSLVLEQDTTLTGETINLVGLIL